MGVQAPAIGLGLWYDAEKLILEGIYLDEVSAYRARRSWIRTFEMNFLLEEIHDFKVKVVFDSDEHRYHVQCMFTSACGRYAFWRLTHHQAPEVQFTLETAHLPHVHSLRFAEPTIEADADSVVPHSYITGGGDVQPESRYEEAVAFLKRKARTYLRKARSVLCAICSR
jgi:hypothetical protein